MRALSTCRFAAVVLAGIALASCSGGSHASPLPSLPAAGSSAASGARFVVSVPLRSAQTAARQKVSVSASVASLVISVKGTVTATTTINIAAGSPNCTASTTQLSCSGTVSLLPGTYVFAINEYDAPNGSGTLLGTGALGATLVAGALTNVGVTLDGVVKSLVLSVSQSTLTIGARAAVTVTLMALDPDGNAIVGPGGYVDASGNPLTVALALSGMGGALSGLGGAALDATTVASPAKASVGLSYSGASVTLPAQLSIAATATGAQSATATLDFVPVGSPAGALFVESYDPNSNNGTMQQWTPDGQMLVNQQISGASAIDFTYDAQGNRYVITQAGIFEYAPGSTTPSRVIAGSNVPPIYSYSFIAVDPSGNIVLVYANNLYVYGSTQSGNVAPEKSIYVTGNGYYEGVGIDATGSLYMNGNYNFDVYATVFPPGVNVGGIPSTLNPTYTATYSGFYGYGIALNGQGDVALAVQMNSPPYTGGTMVVPSTTYKGTPPVSLAPTNVLNLGTTPQGMVLESNGALDLVFANPQGRIQRYAAGATGSDLPLATTTGASSRLESPTKMHADPAGNLAVLDPTPDVNSILTFTVASVGSGGATPISAVVADPNGMNASNVTVAPNGDILVAGTGVDVLQIFSAGTFGSGLPARAFVSRPGVLSSIGAAFEDTRGYLYVAAAGAGGQYHSGCCAVGRQALGHPDHIAPGTANAARTTNSVALSQTFNVFPPGARDLTSPSRSISLPLSATAVDVTPDGTVYAATATQVVVYAPDGTQPTRTVSANGTTLYGMAVDATGTIYLNFGTSVGIVPPNATTVTSSFAPSSSIVFASIAVDANNLYVGAPVNGLSGSSGSFAGGIVPFALTGLAGHTGTFTATALPLLPITAALNGATYPTSFAFGR